MKPLLFVLALTLASPVVAAPPPPPPSYVSDASRVLTSPTLDGPKVGSLFADDVKVYRNGKLIADGKIAWLKLRQAEVGHYYGRVLGYSRSYGGYSEGGGDLLVFDTYDTVDRRNLPPTFIADARPATRSTLYQFGSDRLIHNVRIAEVAGFLETPKE
ncbi:MAG TPA: hypothetical protein VH331_01675 [Allosphingosinicella sp.]|jgi:hypothetical protein|nr:hypothetical protein [Allosphingosinicella sp.]